MIAKSLQRELLLAIAGSLIINVAIGQQAVAVPAESVESAPTAFKNSLASEQTNKKFTALKTATELSEAQSSEAQSSEAQSSEAQTEEVSDNAVSSEMSEITESDGTTVILPPGYDANQSYPALVLMPYTNRTALHMFNWGMYEAYHRRSENAFVVIMPPGQGSSANWSGAGWEAFVDEYEGYVQQDLNPLVAKYNIDPEQLVVGGFSLGGDLSWALSLRNPDIFSGAIVMGSMSTYRDEQNADQLAANRFRYFMVMGGYDGNWNAMQDALANLEQHAISYHYEEVGNAGHGDLPEQMERDLFLSAMDYVLEEQVAVRE